MTPAEIRIDADGCTLAATYLEAAEPVAAALLIVGSGRTDRNSDVRLPLGQKLRGAITGAIAEALAPARVSSLRFDKRGVGASGGDYLTVGMDQRAADARAARDWLAAKTAGLPLIAIGHSEGTYYAAQLAADGQAAGAVLLSGPARSGADVIRVQGTRVNARWSRDFVGYDPAPALARISVPVLAITGEHDLQVPPGDVEVMGRLVQGPFEGHVLPDMSHMLRADPDSLGPRGYRRQTRQPVSPDVLQLITSWVSRNWGQA